MSEKNRKSPEIRFEGFSDDWEQREFTDMLNTNISTNSLSRDMLTDEITTIKNIHYGDILVKYNEMVSAKFDKIPHIIADDKYKYRDSFLQNGDVIFADAAEDETAGKVSEIVDISDELVVSGLHTIVARPIEKVASRYLGYYLNSKAYHNQLLPLMQGTKVMSISKSTLQKTNLNIAKEIQEQTAIGTFFSILDNLITCHQSELDKIKQIKKSMLQKMFPKNENEVPKVRFKDFAGDWKRCELKEITDVRDGTHASPEYYEKGHALVTSKNVSGGFINYNNIQYISDVDFQEINKRSKVDVNDVLMGMIGTVGNIALIRKEPDFAIKNVALIKDTKQVDYLYIYHYLQSTNVEKQLSCNMDGGTQKFIALGKIRKLDILLPSKKEQMKLGMYFETLDNLITCHQRELDLLNKIKKALLQQMFI